MMHLGLLLQGNAEAVAGLCVLSMAIWNYTFARIVKGWDIRHGITPLRCMNKMTDLHQFAESSLTL